MNVQPQVQIQIATTRSNHLMGERNCNTVKPEAEEAIKKAIVPSAQSVERWYRVKVGKYPPPNGMKHGKVLNLRRCRPPSKRQVHIQRKPLGGVRRAYELGINSPTLVELKVEAA